MTNSLEQLKELNGLSDTEKEYALKILKEFYNKGTSKTYDDIVLSEYEEIPVDIETFLRDKHYLGSGLVNDEGNFTVFPFWIKTLKKIFPEPLLPAAFNTLALSGAIGLGKSFVAVLCGLYELYRMICLKDPYMHYGLQPIDKITFAFMNITLDASKGVAWDKCQQLLQASPWFMQKGTLSGTSNIIWNPPKGIELIAGSLSRHIIGRAVYWCLDGDTNIVTTKGDLALKDLVGKTIQVHSVDNNGNIIISDECTVQPTAVTNEEYRITFEDGTIIKCTAEHRFMLKDGTYKEAQNLTIEDDILEFNPLEDAFAKVDKNNSNGYSKFGIIKLKKIEKIILNNPKQYFDVINANPYNNFFIKTNKSYICSHNCFFDEISFQPNMDVEKQKAKAKALVNTASVRMQSRFMKGEKNPTLLVLASSKRTEQSYMETFIEMKKNTDSKTTLVIDEPQWIIRTDKDSPNKFKVAIGNKFLSSEILPLDVTEQDLNIARNKGYKILEVPMGYYENFVEDIDVALTDIAGISTSSSNRYISGPRLAEIKTNTYANAFTQEIIEVGNAPDDTTQYYDFFDIERIPKEIRSKPLYVHYDMSISGDKTGISGAFIIGKKPPAEGQPASKDLFFKLGFSTSIKAPKGYQISFEKNRQFVFWLRENGFNVKGVSSDTFQSVDFGQAMTAHNFNYTVISVDRVDTDHVCLTGDTLVKTTEGDIPISQLDTTYKVVGYDIETDDTVECEVAAWMITNIVDEYIEIETESGVIKCTPNHLILTENGYIEAGMLTENDRIIKI